MIRSLITVPILMYRTSQVVRITTKVIRKDCMLFSTLKNGQQKDGNGKELDKMEIKKSTDQKITNMKNMDIRQPLKENQVTKKQKQNGKEENKESQVAKKQNGNSNEKNTNTKSESESWWEFLKNTFTDKNFLLKTVLFGGTALWADYQFRKFLQDRDFQRIKQKDKEEKKYIYQNSAEYKHKKKMEEKFKQCTEKILPEIDYYVQNNRVERQFRRIMADKYLHIVSGFPGTGKTTAAYYLINKLREKFKKEGSQKKVIYISLRGADENKKSSNYKQEQVQNKKKKSPEQLYDQLSELIVYTANTLPNNVLDGSYFVIDDINRLLSTENPRQRIEYNKGLFDWLGDLQNNRGLKVIAISSSSTYHENIVVGHSSFQKDDLQSITIEPPTQDQIKLSIDKYIQQRKKKNEFVPQIIGKYLSENYVSLRNVFKALDKIKIKLPESQKNKNQQQKLTESQKNKSQQQKLNESQKQPQIDINLYKEEFKKLVNSNKKLFEEDKQLLNTNKIIQPQQMLLKMFGTIKQIEKKKIQQSKDKISICSKNHLKKQLVKPDQIQLLNVILKKQRKIDRRFKVEAFNQLHLKRQQSQRELTYFCDCLQFENVTAYGQPRDEMNKKALQQHLQRLEKSVQNQKQSK